MQAYAAVKFADACLRGLRGDAGVVECAFVPSQACFLFVGFLSELFLLHNVSPCLLSL